MVLYDGEYLVVKLARKDYKKVLELGKTSNHFEYLPEVNAVVLSATKNIARGLFELGYNFDESAKKFLAPTKKELREKINQNLNFKSVDEKYELFQFQKEGVSKMLEMETNILLADEMGLGKTPQGSMYLKLKSGALPAIVICPASLKQNWANEIKKWVGVDSAILEGRNPECLSEEYLKKYPVWIINYDILGTEDKEEKRKEMERRKKAKENGLPFRKKLLHVSGWCDEIIKHDFKTIIADEVQYISELETIRARGVLQICNSLKKSKKLFISGTPYETRTSQFYACLHILAPEYFNNEYKFKMRYCNPVKTYFGWKFDGLSNAEELHSMVSKFMIRRLKKDVLKDLPPKIRAVVPMTVSPSDRKLYDDIDREFELAILSGEKKKSEQLGHIAHLKKGAYKAKQNAVIQWIKDYLTFQNKKLVVFIYHHETYDALMKEFGYCSVGLTGETPANQRQNLVDRFQNDEKVYLFIGQIKASGVGLTLTKASATAFVEFGTTCVQHEQAEDRTHRIGTEFDCVMAYYLVLENSIEQDIMSVLNKRNKDMKKVLDDEENINMFGDSDLNEGTLVEYKRRKGLK